MEWRNKIKAPRLLSAVFAAFMVFFAIFAFAPRTFAENNPKSELYDLDDCLTDREETELKKIMNNVAQKRGINIGVVITANLGQHNDTGFVKAFNDEFFGHKSDSIVLMLLNTHDLAKYRYYEDQIYVSGSVEKNISDKTRDKILDRVYDKLDQYNADSGYGSVQNVYKNYSSGAYFNACKAFCEAVDSYSDSSTRFWSSVGDFVKENSFFLVIGGIAGGIFTAAFVTSTKNKYQKKAPISASQYLDKRRINITRREDVFIREYTTSTTVSSSSSGGSRGGGFHGGGGGHSHGGRHR